MPEKMLTVTHAAGLHLRPAALFVRTAARFASAIHVTNLDAASGQPANAKSMFALTTLGVSQGQRILISAEGADAGAALAALTDLVETDFGEQVAEAPASQPDPAYSPVPSSRPAGQQPGNQINGIAAAGGIAIGPVFHFKPATLTAERYTVDDITAELQRFGAACEHARAELNALHTHVEQIIGGDEAAIFAAHLALLDDPGLQLEIEAFVTEQACNVEAAIETVFAQRSEQLRQQDNALLQARVADLQDIKQRLLRYLLNRDTDALVLPAHPCIILADELLPSQTARLDRARVLAFAMAGGSATAHVAILARGSGLPAVVGIGTAVLNIADGSEVIVDGDTGTIYVDPSEALRNEYLTRAQAVRLQQEQQRAAAQQLAHTRDNQRIEVMANIGSLAEVAAAVTNGAEGVGLLRSEFLFVDRDMAPSEEEQIARYRACAVALGARPLIIRTLDIGSDKPVAYLPATREHNPALGLRGVRLERIAPALLRTQLRAIWRIGPEYDIKVMFPMVTGIDEVRQLCELVATVAQEVRGEEHAMVEHLAIGMMVETPALALQATQALQLVDFLSIGTNDLTQYTLAVDRTNAQVGYLNDALHPAVLYLIERVARAAQAAGKWAGVCGELAGEPVAIPLLVGLGISELSMSPARIPAAKALLGRFSLAKAQAMAQHALTLEDAGAVRAYLAQEVARMEGKT